MKNKFKKFKDRFISSKLEEYITAYVCLLPVFIFGAVFLVFPIFFSLVLSFQKWPLIGEAEFVGLSNYIKIFSDSLMWSSLVNALQYTVLYVPLSIIVALIIALLLNQKIRGVKFYRIGFFIPVVTSTVAAAVVWTLIFNRDYGLLNEWFVKIGLPRIGWLTEPGIAMYSVVIFSLWKNVGMNIILYLAALQGVPQHLYEAARIDGASFWQQFRYITWPMVSPTTFFLFIMGCIGSIQVFEQIYIMTSGGPMKSTYTIFMYMYDHAFKYNEMGMGSAIAYVMAFIILLLTIINMKITGKKVHYN